MDNIAIVVGHIWDDMKLGKGIENFSMAHNDHKGTDVFCEIESALLDQIDTHCQDDYDFIAVVKATWVKEESDWGGLDEWDVEYEVLQVDDIQKALEMYNEIVYGIPTLKGWVQS